MELLPELLSVPYYSNSYVSIYFKQTKEKKIELYQNLLPLQNFSCTSVVELNCLNVCNFYQVSFAKKHLKVFYCCFIQSIVNGSNSHICLYVSRMLLIFVVVGSFSPFVSALFLCFFFAQICKCGNRSLDVLNCTLFAVSIYIWNCLLSI